MRLGFLFPGQGAQRVGMIGDIAASSTAVAQRYEQASEALGFDLGKILRSGPAEELNKTEITQPALLTVSTALLDAWRARGGANPDMVAGHSLGEYSALTASGALDFATAVRLVHERGKLMQQAVPAGEGAMAAIIGLDDATIADCCAAVDGVATPANYNSPDQVVIAGETAAVAAAAAACREAGARRVIPLDVSVPSHCPLMAPAGDALAQLLDAVALAAPNAPVVQNFDAAVAPDVVTIRHNLLRQLVSPVRWSASVVSMANAGLHTFVECGPGNTLAGLARRIDRSLTVHRIDSLAALDAALVACAANKDETETGEIEMKEQP